MQPKFREFVEPPWSAPVDVTTAVRSVPESATISGMFLEPLAELGRLRGDPLPSARERYTQFRFYPLREHVSLLIETCARHYAVLPLREALRKLGRGAPTALVQSTIGKVMLNSASGVEESIRALAKTYELNLRPGSATPLEFGRNYAIIRMENIHYFLDSHHVGTFESIIKFAGARGSVRIASHSATSADFLCTWRT